MGFLDNIFKAVKVVSDIASEIENVSDKVSDIVSDKNVAQQQAGVVLAAKPSVLYTNSFYDEVNGEEVEVEFSFMISGDFIEFESNAAEADPVFTYEPELDNPEDLRTVDLNKPYIFFSMGDQKIYELVYEYKQNGTVDGLIEKYDGKCLFKCKTKYYNNMMVFYGMDRGIIWENCGIAVVYPMNLAGTSLEKKLIAILDEVAQTYVEKIK